VARTQDAGRICTAGRHVAVRPGGPADAEALRSFITGLSQRTQHRRFFAGVAPPGGPLLRALCGTGNGADIVVAACRCPACADRARGGQIVGHAMAVHSVGADGIPAVEVGLVVADGSQRRGVGSALMRTLLARAVARGARVLVMDVLPGNAEVLSMIARHWPAASCELTADSVVIRARLAAPASAAGIRVPARIPVAAGQPA
jgi:GNAT superfamily N-acetyltransferase